MAQINGEYQRVRSAYKTPTLALISRSQSPVIVTILRTMFTTEAPTVSTSRMHDQVQLVLADLRRAGVSDKEVPAGNGRDVCLKWLRDGWLIRSTAENGEEIYSLTANALDGLRTVDRLTKDRAVTLSSHLINGLVRHLKSFAAAMAPDVTTYLAMKQAEKAAIQAEIDRITDGGDLSEAGDDEIIQGFTELQRYLGELPSDFTRVVESYREFETQTITDFRTSDISSGQAVKMYMAHVKNLATASAAGRGFEGALELLRDTELLDQVNRDIATLLEDERASALLSVEERAQVRNTVALIRDGLKRVLESRSRVSKTLHDYIQSHDVERDHELAATLRALEAEAHEWMQTAGPRAKPPMQLLEGKLGFAHLRTRLYDPANDQPPPPLATIENAPGSSLTLAELRARGGPSHAALREQLIEKFTASGGVDSLAALFHDLPDDLRRPVEVLGVLPLARSHGLEPTGETEIYETIRHDGTKRRFSVPHYANADDTQARTAQEQQ